MGTDIHGFVEYRDERNEWRALFALACLPRHYPLWDKMAGARAGEAIFEKRGWPDDVDEFGLYLMENEPCDHSHSWLTADEIERCLKECIHDDPEMRAIIAAMRTFKEARLVFAFDN